ncbi:MAG: hypothetical protein AAB569_05575, partial [Patescibacteria group bacterium]
MFKKLLNIFFIISIYILFSKDVFAFQFEKSPNNPLPISYINNYANQLQANIFKEGDVYKGIFAINKPPETYYSLGYFESTNGVDWQ